MTLGTVHRFHPHTLPGSTRAYACMSNIRVLAAGLIRVTWSKFDADTTILHSPHPFNHLSLPPCNSHTASTTHLAHPSAALACTPALRRLLFWIGRLPLLCRSSSSSFTSHFNHTLNHATLHPLNPTHVGSRNPVARTPSFLFRQRRRPLRGVLPPPRRHLIAHHDAPTPYPIRSQHTQRPLHPSTPSGYDHTVQDGVHGPPCRRQVPHRQEDW